MLSVLFVCDNARKIKIVFHSLHVLVTFQDLYHTFMVFFNFRRGLHDPSLISQVSRLETVPHAYPIQRNIAILALVEAK